MCISQLLRVNLFCCSYQPDEWRTAEPGGFRLPPNGAKQARYPSCAKKMGPLITEPPPSSPYDYSPHVLANSLLHRNYCDILRCSARFHPFSLFIYLFFSHIKIPHRLTFQLNPLSVAKLNISREEIWLCLFYAIKNDSVESLYYRD